MVRVSGPRAIAIARAAGIELGPAWRPITGIWRFESGRCPCRTLLSPGPRSATGHDLVEISLPGSRDLIEVALSSLRAAGAVAAMPGEFTRQALANARLTLDQAEAVLAVTRSADADGAALALSRLRGGIGSDAASVRSRLLHARALVEAGLDFLDEGDVRAFDVEAMRAELTALADVLRRWCVAAVATEGIAVVCLAGPANSGKSALFSRLTGSPALVSPIAGTTRDPLDAPMLIDGRPIRLVDTAGWLDAHSEIDRAAMAAGRSLVDVASLVIACSAPDARLPAEYPTPPQRTVVIATKSDLGSPDSRAALTVSASTGDGITALIGLISSRLAGTSGGEPRQQRLLEECLVVLDALRYRIPADELLAEDLRTAAALLGELIGATTPDDILDEIFSRFCIGK